MATVKELFEQGIRKITKPHFPPEDSVELFENPDKETMSRLCLKTAGNRRDHVDTELLQGADWVSFPYEG
jgi:hypothetical protein